MAVTRLYKLSNDALVPIAQGRLATENMIQNWIAQKPDLLGLDLLIIGREVMTPDGGRIDLHCTVIEKIRVEFDLTHTVRRNLVNPHRLVVVHALRKEPEFERQFRTPPISPVGLEPYAPVLVIAKSLQFFRKIATRLLVRRRRQLFGPFGNFPKLKGQRNIPAPQAERRDGYELSDPCTGARVANDDKKHFHPTKRSVQSEPAGKVLQPHLHKRHSIRVSCMEAIYMLRIKSMGHRSRLTRFRCDATTDVAPRRPLGGRRTVLRNTLDNFTSPF
jgi:hypothetical protein